MADGGIESQNTVGYTTIALTGAADKAVYYMSGAQFKDTASATDTIPVTKLVTLTNVTPGTYRTRNTDAPQVQVYNGGTYTRYYYISDANLIAGGTGTAWATGRNEATGTIDLGAGFWLYLPQGSVGENATAVLAGEVKTDANTKTFEVGTSPYTMMLNPFPTDLTFDMLTTTGITPGTYRTRNTDAPQIQVYNNGTYTRFYYINDANLTAGGTGTAWASGRNQATATIAGPGAGFWVKSDTAGSITVTLP